MPDYTPAEMVVEQPAAQPAALPASNWQENETLLCSATTSNQPDLVLKLLLAGTDPNAPATPSKEDYNAFTHPHHLQNRSTFTGTPLSIAFVSKHALGSKAVGFDVVEKLLVFGGKVGKDEKQWAVQRSWKYHDNKLEDLLSAVEGWSPLEMAAGFRMHAEARAGLRRGLIPVPVALDEVQQVLRIATFDEIDLGWPAAKPVCKVTEALLRDVLLNGYGQKTHWLYQTEVRAAAHTVLLVQARLKRANNVCSVPASTERIGGSGATPAPLVAATAAAAAAKGWVESATSLLGMVFASAAASPLPAPAPAPPSLPALAPDTWMHILNFFLRSDWEKGETANTL